YHGGILYVSNRGKITAVDATTGEPLDLIMGVRNQGDYRTNQIAFGPDGRLYFGQGAATNSGVIGEDNYEWFRIMPSYYGVVPFYDVPGQNITLTGQNFESSNMFTPVDPSDSATTGAFVPYGNITTKGQNITGDPRCTACIVSANPDGTDLKVVAWGLRNPYGLAFDSNNKLIVSVDGADERGNRPIANDEDKVYSIDVLNSTSSNSSKFYGWPDYFGNGEPVTSGKFQSNSSSQPLQFLMQNHPSVEKPLALVGLNATVTQIAMSNNSNFGFKGSMFIGEFGSVWYSPFGSIGVPSPDATTSSAFRQQQASAASNTTGAAAAAAAPSNITAEGEGGNVTNGIDNNTAITNTTRVAANNTDAAATNTTNQTAAEIAGQKVIVFDPNSGNYSNFLSLKNPDPSFHPVDVEFSHDGSTLYVASVGKVEMRDTTPQGHELPAPMPWFHQNTGALWRITNMTTVEQGPSAENEVKLNEIQLTPALNKTINSGPPPDTSYLDIQDGYKIQPILWDIDKPGSIAFDDKGNMYIASEGVTYGKQSTTPAIYKVDANGTVSLFMDRPLHGILSDIEFSKENGKMYVAHRNLLSTIDMETGMMQDLVVGIPTSPYVTHPMGQIAFGPNGRVYFGVGGLSNTAVPDISDYGIGFIAEMPFMHEVPPYNITLEGINFQSDNFLTAEFTDLAVTGGFRPFGVPAYKGQIIEGHPLCTSCIWSINPNGSDFKVEAWGARNPFGMAFDDKGRLFWSNNGNDDKGIRRVTADVDTVSVLDVSQDNITFFGWPDIIGMGESISLDKFNQSPAQNYSNVPLISDPPPTTAPLVDLGGAVAASQLAYSTSDEFGSKGKMFLAEFGTSAPVQHIHQIPKERSPGSVMGQMIGQRVVVIDTETGGFGDFISLNAPESSFRPVGLQFSPDGSTLYIASIEDHVIRKVTPTGAILGSHAEWPYAVTGVIYKVWKEDSSPSSQNEISTTATAIGEKNQANSTSNNTSVTTNSTIPRREESQ
nr:hypothetical protein [Thermoproteota archaeon]